MNLDIQTDRNFSFKRKPSPVPGDLRIGWRVPVTLLMLNNSRGKKASLAKLNLMNDALRSEASREKLASILRGQVARIEWRMRVEPAFGRNLDLLTGGGLAEWSVANGKAAIYLTEKGKEVSKFIQDDSESFSDEKSFLTLFSTELTEGFVNQILAANKAPA
ncbi:MAG: hypothetical protein ABJN36_17375 [Cyclobacteriaceae bacterium]